MCLKWSSKWYLILLLGTLVPSLISLLFGYSFSLVSFLLAGLTFSSLLYVFVAHDFATHSFINTIFDLKHVLQKVMLLHICLSAVQLPIQIVQLIANWGLSLSVFSLNISAGDVAYGTLGHSGVLAYKATFSLFFLALLRILAHVDHRFWKRLITHSGLS
jgi:hypothetical protein